MHKLLTIIQIQIVIVFLIEYYTLFYIQEDVNVFKAGGVDTVLHKPVSRSLLFETLREFGVFPS